MPLFILDVPTDVYGTFYLVLVKAENIKEAKEKFGEKFNFEDDDYNKMLRKSAIYPDCEIEIGDDGLSPIIELLW